MSLASSSGVRVRAACVAALLAVLAAPAGAQIAVLGALVREQTGTPGRSYSGAIVLVNQSDEVQEARLSRVDYSFSADGRTSYDPPGSRVRSNAAWITLTPAALTLTPHQSATVGYTVLVPASDSLVGTYWSVVMVETTPPGEAGSSVAAAARARPRVEVTLSVRVNYAIQIATHIGTTGTSRIEFTDVAATTDSTGRRLFDFDFLNAGERAHQFVLSLELYSAGGELVGRFQQRRGLFYPGTSGRQRFDLGPVPRGRYTAVLLADAGGGEVFATQFPIEY